MNSRRRLAALPLSMLVALFSLLGGAEISRAAEAMAHAELKDLRGRVLGQADLTETPNGVAISVRFSGMPPGVHAFHVHGAGKCEAPFDSAGGHFNPGGKKHGFANAEGWHAGDLPNIHIPESGTLDVEVFAPGVKLTGAGMLLDEDGATLMVHEGPDDGRTDPTGNAGARIACGVIEKK